MVSVLDKYIFQQTDIAFFANKIEVLKHKQDSKPKHNRNTSAQPCVMLKNNLIQFLV